MYLFSSLKRDIDQFNEIWQTNRNNPFSKTNFLEINMRFTFGSDPEFMLVDEHGHYKSAIGIVPGSKCNKYKKNNCCYYYDNVLAECNVEPANTKSQAVKNVKTALSGYARLLHPHKIISQAAQKFPKIELETPEALIVGCSSESCAYELMDIDTTKLKKKFQKNTLRTAGGHIHLGTELGKNFISCVSLIRMLDLFVGIPSLFIDHDPTSQCRRKLYGMPGRYRQPEHGIEYRSLSNFWLASPELVKLIYDLCDFTISFVENGHHNQLWEIDEIGLKSMSWEKGDDDPRKYHQCIKYDIKLLKHCFKLGDRDAATPLLQYALSFMPDSLCNRISKAAEPQHYDLYQEWSLN